MFIPHQLKHIQKAIITLLLFASSYLINSQTSIKGNALTALIGVPNFGAEFNLSKKTTFQIDAAASFWTIDGIPYKFALVFPEFRYYPKESGRGFFVGAHIGGGKYKLQKWNHTNDYQDGYSVFYGLTTGYQFWLSDRLNLEVFLGGGSQQGYYKGYSLETGERTDIGAKKYNKSGELIPYRGGLMLVYKLNSKTKNKGIN
ncbi:Protein of unknown function [Flaviramulus basaltis]|uniref:DUF3575 domain-containing protein n=1 Tax=Flaviramulus basaltis TaxID=369401 RepID=A0A1K2IH62_9FLAO|nr:DUF3575 domain-containing protein [Flaviramulus basaltis]SFZ91638.1 Protein of unknown function [Flaviramulus basaltis]